jgi:hypothetical protein
MAETLSYIPILKGADVNAQDKALKLLVNAGIDCYIDEKQNIVVHPDQYQKSNELLN